MNHSEKGRLDRSAPVGVFDSGMGGLSVLAALIRRLPGERFVYLSDPEHLPYGSRSEEEIRLLTEKGVRRLLAAGCKAVVLACNTATNAAAEAIRTWYPTLLGVEPAVKPAVAAVRGKVLVLTTPATVCRRKFLELCRRYGQNRLIVSPQPDLAARIEADFFRPESLLSDVRQALKPFPEAEAVVLGCTHYALIRPLFERFLPAFDGAEGVANRTAFLLAGQKLSDADRGNKDPLCGGLEGPVGEKTGPVLFLDPSSYRERYQRVLSVLLRAPEGEKKEGV